MSPREEAAIAICAAKSGPGHCRVEGCRGIRCLFWRNHLHEADAAIAAYEKARAA